MSTGANGASGWLRRRTAEEIRVLLARRRMSAAELARRTGIKQSTISRRMTGETAFDLDDLEAIARVLDVEVVDLLPRLAGASTSGGEVGASSPNDRSAELSLSADARTAQLPRPPARGKRHVAAGGSPYGGGRRDSTGPVSPIPASRRRPTLTGSGNRPITDR